MQVYIFENRVDITLVKNKLFVKDVAHLHVGDRSEKYKTYDWTD